MAKDLLGQSMEFIGDNILDIILVVLIIFLSISYLFVLSKKDINRNKIKNIIDVEKIRGLQSEKTYEKYRENVLKITRDFTYEIQSAREDGYTIIGYGAAAKGMTLLNFADVKLDYIIDDNPLKQNLYTPGTNIEIKSIDLR